MPVSEACSTVVDDAQKASAVRLLGSAPNAAGALDPDGRGRSREGEIIVDNESLLSVGYRAHVHLLEARFKFAPAMRAAPPGGGRMP